MHWTRPLSKDSCCCNEPMHNAHLFPLLLSCLYLFKTGLCNINVTKIMRNTGEPMPNFFLVIDSVVFGPGVVF